MRRPPYMNEIETGFAVPAGPDVPAIVEAAWATFDSLAVQLDEARQELKGEKRIRRDAQAADRQANVEDYAAGCEPKNPRRHADAAEKRIAALHAKAEGLLGAIDQAGDQLAEAIDAERDGWLEAARERLDADHAAYIAALTDARAAAQRLSASRGIVGWLDGWRLVRGGNGSLIVADQDMCYRGPARVSVNTGNVRRYELVRATELLDLLGTVEPEESAAPQLRRHKVALESSR